MENINENVERRRKKKKGFPVISTLIIIGCAVVMAVALYNIIKIKLEYKHISDTNNSIISAIVKEEKPAAENAPPPSYNTDLGFSYDHNAALSMNNDTKALFYMPSTSSKLPVVQAKDNDYYLHRDFYGNYSRGGTLFIEAEIREAMAANYVIIYGHHMNDNSMFTPNNNYKDEVFYRKNGNDVFYLLTGDGVKKYKIFSVFNVEPTNESVYSINYSPEQLKARAEKWKSMSKYDTGVDISNARQVVALSSCEATNYNYRLVIMGTLVEESPYKNLGATSVVTETPAENSNQ